VLIDEFMDQQWPDRQDPMRRLMEAAITRRGWRGVAVITIREDQIAAASGWCLSHCTGRYHEWDERHVEFEAMTDATLFKMEFT
jgi:hypothetical protein